VELLVTELVDEPEVVCKVEALVLEELEAAVLEELEAGVLEEPAPVVLDEPEPAEVVDEAVVNDAPELEDAPDAPDAPEHASISTINSEVGVQWFGMMPS